MSATSAPISESRLQHLRNVKRLSDLVYTGPGYIESHNTKDAAWTTIYDSLANGFIAKYADPLSLLGVGFGPNTGHNAFDIDRYSKYHPCNDPQAFWRFLRTLYRIGLTTPVIVQSSWSGGIHVYYFLDRDVNTFRLASLCQVTLIDAKFTIKNGTLELFPNCKPRGDKSNHKPLRLPLQPNGGGLLLDQKGNPLVSGENDNHETQLAAFLQLAKASARGNDSPKILRQLDPVYAQFKNCPSKYQYININYKKGLSDKAKIWKADLEVIMGIGWTDYHETNNLTKNFVQYAVVFLDWSDKKELYEWVYQAVTNSNGYKQYCRHQHQIEAKILGWIKLTIKKSFYLKYCAHPPRSRDRVNFIAKHKTSKASPTSPAELYNRQRVDEVVSIITDVVETILATIADLPSRTEDLISLIQLIAREKYGKAPSRNTLYKPHYKYLWVKLKDTNKLCDIVPTTLITPPNMEYCSQTCTEQAFGIPVFCVADPSEKNLKPFSGETSHSTPSVCSVNAAFLPPPTNEADLAPNLKKNVPLDLDPDRDLGLKHISLNPTHPQSAPSDLDTNPQSNSIEPPGVDLIGIPTHDREQSIHPDLDKLIGSDPKARDLFLSPIHSQSLTDPNLIDRGTNSRFNRIDTSGVNLIIRSYPDWGQSIKPDPIYLNRLGGYLSLNPIEPDSIHSQSSLVSDLPNFDTSYQTDPIEPPEADLESRSVHDQDKSIKPNPDPEEDLSLDRIDLQSAPTVSLPNLDSNPQPDPIEPSTADLTSRLYSDQKPTLKYFKSLSLDQKLQLTEQQIQEIRLSRFPLIEGCFVRPFDKYHVHGADRGIVIEIQAWGVYVSWSDGTSGRYAVDELICTYSPNLKH